MKNREDRVKEADTFIDIVFGWCVSNANKYCLLGRASLWYYVRLFR